MDLNVFATYLIVMSLVTVVATASPNIFFQLIVAVVAFGGFLFISWPKKE